MIATAALVTIPLLLTATLSLFKALRPGSSIVKEARTCLEDEAACDYIGVYEIVQEIDEVKIRLERKRYSGVTTIHTMRGHFRTTWSP